MSSSLTHITARVMSVFFFFLKERFRQDGLRPYAVDAILADVVVDEPVPQLEKANLHEERKNRNQNRLGVPPSN